MTVIWLFNREQKNAQFIIHNFFPRNLSMEAIEIPTIWKVKQKSYSQVKDNLDISNQEYFKSCNLTLQKNHYQTMIYSPVTVTLYCDLRAGGSRPALRWLDPLRLPRKLPPTPRGNSTRSTHPKIAILK